jgi:shikimate dehydrogenase
MKSLKEDLSFDPEGARVLILGAGGAARAALVGLAQAGISEVTVANRTSETAEELLAVLDRCGTSVVGSHSALSIFSSRGAMGSFDLIVNTTSVGMNGTSFEGFDVTFLKADACIYDMVYVPAETPLLKVARERSLKTANGAGMLAAQGEEAFRLWTGCDPPAGIMKETILAALAPAA